MSGVVIGLTGGIGVGKSTVADLLARRGAEVVDVDGLGRAVLEPGGGAYAGVIETFGRAVVGDDGRIDRAALATEVFGDTSRLDELEAISHPAINRRLDELIDATSAEILVLDMAVLAESTLGRTTIGPLYHRVVVVEAPIEVRIARLLGRGMTENQARDRMAAQASDAERRALADVVVVNDSTLEELRRRVEVIWPSVEAWAVQERAR